MPHHIALIGIGTIGISFAALHLKHSDATVSVHDPRADLEAHVQAMLPGYLDSTDPTLAVTELLSCGRLKLSQSLQQACVGATIVQEQGPENVEFKKTTWAQVEAYVSSSTHLWSSTSGIAASLQNAEMQDKSRLLVVHPFNPPHIMPLLEIVPAPTTSEQEIAFARTYFDQLGAGHRVVVVKRELPGFVGNRLAFILLQEACYLVSEGVISVEDLDTLVEASLGPRWALTGPFKSYNAGGGSKGVQGFLDNLSGTIQNVWDSGGRLTIKEGGEETSPSWETKVVQQTTQAYGLPTSADFAVRDRALREVLQTQERMKEWRKHNDES